VTLFEALEQRTLLSAAILTSPTVNGIANMAAQIAPAATLPAPVATGAGSTSSPGPVLTSLTPTLSWHAISEVTFTGYQVNIFDVTAQAFASHAVGASVTSYTPATALTAGHQYVWNVRALNGTVSGPPGTYYYFQTPPAAVLPAPVATAPGSTVSPGPVLTTLDPTFSWKAITGVSFTGYQINIFDVTANTGHSYTVGKSVANFTPATQLVAGNDYVWNVRALNGTISGPPSEYLYFRTPVLPQPVILGVGSTSQPGTVISTLTPTFTWKPVTGVTFDSYQINLYDQTTAKFVSIQVSPTATSYTLPAGTLTKGDSYVWNLRIKIGKVTGPESTTYLYFQAE
jgi:hypothetical protein